MEIEQDKQMCPGCANKPKDNDATCPNYIPGGFHALGFDCHNFEYPNEEPTKCILGDCIHHPDDDDATCPLLDIQYSWDGYFYCTNYEADEETVQHPDTGEGKRP